MSDVFHSLPSEHRLALAKLIEQAKLLQGELLAPREYKLFDRGKGTYLLHFYDYPLGVDARQLRRINRLQYVAQAWVDFSQRGTHAEAQGALCVQVDMAPSGGQKKREAPAPDSDEDDDAELELTRHRRRSEFAQDKPNPDASWFARLWS